MELYHEIHAAFKLLCNRAGSTKLLKIELRRKASYFEKSGKLAFSSREKYSVSDLTQMPIVLSSCYAMLLAMGK